MQHFFDFFFEKKYFLIFIYKNLSLIDKKECKAIISELISSAHDIAQISQHYLKMRLDFEKIYPNKPFSFRLIVTDWSWATIHSLIEQFNMQSIHQYADMMFEFSQGTKKIQFKKFYKIFL